MLRRSWLWGREDTMRRSAITFSIVLALLLSTVEASAAPVTSRMPTCAGTYLVVGDSGTWAMWTLSADGTAQVTNSSEDAYSFSHEQGAWRQLPSGVVNATVLDFTVEGAASPTQVARVDASMTFSNACHELAGDLELRNYAVPSEDPLDMNAVSVIFSESFTGRLVTAH
jgi:hypothetical protein